MEPIGYDVSHNAYYLLGGDRLWIQRVPPRKPRKLAKKKPSTTAKKSEKKKQAPKVVLQVNSRKRPATPELTEPSTRASKRIKQGAQGTAASRSSRPSRAAAADANRKLAALPKATMNSRATRASARLGALENEVWEEIPEEWLRPPPGSDGDHKSPAEEEEEEAKSKPDFIFDTSESELTSLSELSELSDTEDESEGEPEAPKVADEDEDIRADEFEDYPSLPVNIIEWENVCHLYSGWAVFILTLLWQIVVTLQDWEEFPIQFEKSTNYLEKGFYKVLMASGGIVQMITEELRVRL
jgi:hypothetical protein